MEDFRTILELDTSAPHQQFVPIWIGQFVVSIQAGAHARSRPKTDGLPPRRYDQWEAYIFEHPSDWRGEKHRSYISTETLQSLLDFLYDHEVKNGRIMHGLRHVPKKLSRFALLTED